MSILAAEIPATPTAPVTAVNGDNVDITWSEPDAEGSDITEYTVYLKKADGAFTLELAYCDGRI